MSEAICEYVYKEAPDDVFQHVVCMLSSRLTCGLNACRMVDKRTKKVAEALTTRICIRKEEEESPYYQNPLSLKHVTACARLEHLKIGQCCGIEDLTPLVACTRLKTLVLPLCLQLCRASGMNMSFLASMPFLETLKLSYSTTKPYLFLLPPKIHTEPYMDLSPLKACHKMRVLQVDCWVMDLGFLSALPLLEKLALHFPDLEDHRPSYGLSLSPVSSLSQLASLSLTSMHITDIGHLRHCTQLTWLTLEDIAISSLTPLSAVVSLQVLKIGGGRSCTITDLGPVSNLVNLRRLDVYNIKVTDLPPLKALACLETLCITNTELDDLSPLSNMSRLLRLEIACNPISDLSFISNMTQLLTLEMSETPIADLGPISNLVNLEKLDISSTLVSDLTPLSNLTSLIELHLDGNKYTDFMPLEGLQKGAKVYTGGDLDATEYNKLSASLPNCMIYD